MATVVATKTRTKYAPGTNKVAAKIVAGEVYKTTQKAYKVFGVVLYTSPATIFAATLLVPGAYFVRVLVATTVAI